MIQLMKMCEEDIPQVLEIIRTSFPKTERRLEETQRKYFENPKCNVVVYKENDTVIGFISYWILENANYIEYLATSQNVRNNGMGRNIMQSFLNSTNKITFLEAEEGLGEIEKRRLNFYSRLGFVINDYDYIQPPMQPNQPPIKLILLSHPKVLDKAYLDRLRDALYKNVYGILP